PGSGEETLDSHHEALPGRGDGLEIIGSSSGLFRDIRHLVSASHYKETPSPLSMEEIIARHDLGVINFLKVDIEGSEFDLLSSDIEWLSCVENIVMEVHTDLATQIK